MIWNDRKVYKAIDWISHSLFYQSGRGLVAEATTSQQEDA
jgi:hypothetical protein